MQKLLISCLAVLVLSCGLQGASSAARSQPLVNGPSVEPVALPNEQYPFTNPTCADLGYSFELKIDNVNGPFSGAFTSSDGYLTVTGTSTDGTSFSFTSNVGVDVVLMKGGDGANAYFYAPETTGDSNLVSPDNSSGGPAAISHVTFCYDFEVQVAKSAATKLKRDFDWTISKTSSTTSLILSTGQTQAVAYDVTVASSGHTDSDFAVEGTITITNPAPIAATIETVTDAMGSVTAPVDCGQALPIVLAPGGSLVCTYASALPDASTLTNVATVTTSGLVGGNSGSASVDFAGAAVTVIDGCVDVTDSMVGALGQLCLADAPRTFSYTANVGPYDAAVCGQPFPVDNTATFSAQSGETGSAMHSISVEVVCPPIGCTLTQGYWKTHSSHGPAPYDDTWAQLPQGSDTPFFSTGKTWYQVLWTAPMGSAYLILAHQWMAATLSGLNGADTSAVSAQLAAAEALLSAYTPATLPMRKRSEALNLAAALDAYNNGLTGPGHCSE